jgi:dTDP-4-amino-4,6-dideoxygalactose transaminase
MNNVRRDDIAKLADIGLNFDAPWQVVDHFEKIVAEYFGSTHAVAVDCCTHGIELVLRLLPRVNQPIKIPAHTYMSVPMTLEILGIDYQLTNEQWYENYTLDPYPIIDAATQWKENSYVSGTYTVLSFQFQKHLAIGRGGMILLDNEQHYDVLQRMVRDGRDRTIGHNIDNVKSLGFHYYLTPEDAARGITLFYMLKNCSWEGWNWKDYTDLRNKDFFRDK